MKKLALVHLVLIALAAAWIIGCSSTKAPPAKSPHIITFAPHITQIALALGLKDHIVGVTSHCQLPDGMKAAVLGDGFHLSAEAASVVKPDILFHNTDDTDFRRTLAGVKLVRLENGSLAKLFDSIQRMGDAMNCKSAADDLIERIQGDLADIKQSVIYLPRPRVLFILGTEKPTTVGAGWTLSELIEIAGGTNAAAEAGIRNWSTINLETVQSLSPDVLICQVDPGAGNVEAARKYWQRWTAIKAVRTNHLIVTDDASLTIEDSRVAIIARKLAAWIHPDISAVQAATAPAEAAP